MRAKLLAIALSTLFALLLFEGALRLLGVQFPTFVVVDPVTGVWHVPGARGFFTREGRGWVEIDEGGLRGPSRAVEKPPGVLRVAILGDSFTEALQVDDGVSFVRQLEPLLSAALGRPVEALNFGVSGFGTAQELITLQSRVWPYRPDAVVLALLSGNDIADNHPALKGAAHVPYFQLQGDALVLDRGYLSSELQRDRDRLGTRLRRAVVRRLRLAQLVNEAVTAWQARRATAGPAAGAELGLDSAIYGAPTGRPWTEAWALTERLLVVAKDEARAHGVPFFLVTLSNGAQVHPDPARRAETARGLGVTELFYPDRRLGAFGARVGIPTLLLAPALAEEAERRKVFLHGFGRALGSGHWNADGHRAAATRIAAWLAPQLAGP